MNKNDKEIEAIKEKYHKQIEKMGKMILNMYAVSNIRFWYSCLKNFRKSDDQARDLFEMEAFVTSIIVSYGRLFGKGSGSSKLEDDIIRPDLRSVHEKLINLRHAKYAHHGELSAFYKDLQLEYIDNTFIINPKIEIEFCLGAPKEWEPLFEYLSNYMYDFIHNILNKLTEETGIQWKFPHGPAPSWI
ncbi:hypothetical protein BCY89_27675 [Sphingobacterium siyangense]|uniref:HEPN AbiU2-like domain-containing protein n=1 Tax=Sphingobacterium siyangense TaxID=459529 RepID=A0A420FXK8_9SPHI|nr:hypothetical protein [Sphingobacterium siyangense]RKF37661.1 hypothetical protein BCY89_27675 [Sphingobacterium siyangense]